jgi:hypothetical protein
MIENRKDSGLALLENNYPHNYDFLKGNDKKMSKKNFNHSK